MIDILFFLNLTNFLFITFKDLKLGLENLDLNLLEHCSPK